MFCDVKAIIRLISDKSAKPSDAKNFLPIRSTEAVIIIAPIKGNIDTINPPRRDRSSVNPSVFIMTGVKNPMPNTLNVLQNHINEI